MTVTWFSHLLVSQILESLFTCVVNHGLQLMVEGWCPGCSTGSFIFDMPFLNAQSYVCQWAIWLNITSIKWRNDKISTNTKMTSYRQTDKTQRNTHTLASLTREVTSNSVSFVKCRLHRSKRRYRELSISPRRLGILASSPHWEPHPRTLARSLPVPSGTTPIIHCVYRILHEYLVINTFTIYTCKCSVM